ncbi:hypothetical protein SNE510_23000 [Streptomyces sp. NE5-10]|nr:hypothetical protein SNE510_23000 [Streptomyces sp. NE5-10]
MLSPPSVAEGRAWTGPDVSDASGAGVTSGVMVIRVPWGVRVRVRTEKTGRGYGSVTYGDVSMAARRHAARGHKRGAPPRPGNGHLSCERRTARSASLQNPPDVLEHCKEPHL